jgi:hypothetical protein
MRSTLPTFAIFVAGWAYGQSSAAPEFEVASVKVSKLAGLLENHTPTLNVEPGRDIHFENIQLRDLIMLAYGVGIRQISAPLWLFDPAGETNDSPRFDVIAKVPADATKDQVPLMFVLTRRAAAMLSSFSASFAGRDMLRLIGSVPTSDALMHHQNTPNRTMLSCPQASAQKWPTGATWLKLPRPALPAS